MNVRTAHLSLSVMNLNKMTSKATLGRTRLQWLAFVCCLMGPCVAQGIEADVRRDATVQAVERTLPSVVNIATRFNRQPRKSLVYDWWRDNFRVDVQEVPPDESAGSGVIIDEDGYVVTNVHVVEGADEIWVKLSDGRIFKAKPHIIGQRDTDVALLQLETTPGEKFKAIKFAMDDDLLLGETVLALGNPFGLGGSVSRGILSSKSRRMSNASEPLDVADWLQTDAAINPGNSGGALVNLRGELIGINVAVLKVGQGIGFAIPIKRVTEALGNIFTPEVIGKQWFGATFKPGVSPPQVLAVEPASPADVAGLRKGDSILNVGGTEPRSFIAATLGLIGAADKGAVPVTVRRGGEQKNIQVRLAPEESFFNADLIRRRLGLTVELNRNVGFVVTDVEAQGPAAAAGIKREMLIRSIDGLTPDNMVSAARMIHARNKSDRLKLDLLVQQRRGPFVSLVTAKAEVVVR
jgi:serine protease Do